MVEFGLGSILSELAARDWLGYFVLLGRSYGDDGNQVDGSSPVQAGAWRD
jgi:hypothetical protein